MKIGDLRPSVTTPVLRNAAATPAAPAAPVDGVEIAGGAASADLGSAGGATAAAVAMTALAPRDLSREEIKILVETLERSGVEIQSRRKYLWFYGDFKADAERSAKMLDTGKEGRVVARAQGMDWVPVRGQGDLRELEVFRGGAAPENLQKPELARALLGLEKAGATFRSEDDPYYDRSKVGAYGAYNVLTGDAEKLTDVHARTKSGEKVMLKSADEALALAFFENVGGAQGLERPAQAESIRLLAMNGLSLPDKPFMQYRFLGNSKPDATLAVSYANARLTEITVADMQDPVALAARLGSLKQDYDGVMAAVGRDAVHGCWKILQEDGSPRPVADRLAALAQLQKAVSGPEPLYREVLASTPEGRDLNTREALELARLFQRPTGETVTRAWQELRRLASESQGKLSMAELKMRFTLLLAQTQDPAKAVQALDVLSTSGPAQSYGDREAAFLQLRALPKAHPDLVLQATKALATHGGLPADAPRMAELLGNGAREEAPAAYEHLKTSVPPELHDSFAKVFASVGELKTAVTAFATLGAGPVERVAARVETWRGFMAVGDSWNRAATATEAVGLLQEGPDFDRQAGIMKRVLAFGGGRSLAETWKKVLHHRAGESYLRLCEAGRSTNRADEAMSLLDRPELAANGRPFAERAEALALLMTARDNDLARGTDDFRFLAAWTPQERSLTDTARHLSALEKVAGAAEGRLALGAAETSPPGGKVGPTTYSSLVDALKVGGTLAESRGLWTWLEEGGSPQVLAAAARIVPERSAGRAGRVHELVQTLTAVQPGPDELAAVVKACEALRIESGDSLSTFAQEVVSGEGPCGPRVEAFTTLAKALGNSMTALSLWSAVRDDVGQADFAERCAALAALHRGRDGAETLNLFPAAVASTQPGESVLTVATLLGNLGADGFQAVRRWLDAGTVEGRPDPENTRFLATLSQGTNRLESLKAAWDQVARPVFRESTAERREAFLALHAGQKPEATVALWTELTSWLVDGESLLDVARSFRSLGDALGQESSRAVQLIRQNQRAGKLGQMTLPEAMQRLVSIAGTSLTGRGRNVDSLVQALVESAGPEAEARDIRQSEGGGVRIGSIELPGRS